MSIGTLRRTTAAVHGYNLPMISSRPLITALLALTACTATAQHNPLATSVPSPNHNARTPIIKVAAEAHYFIRQSGMDDVISVRIRNQ